MTDNPLQQAARHEEWYADALVARILRRLAQCDGCKGTGYIADIEALGTTFRRKCPDCAGTGHSKWVQTDPSLHNFDHHGYCPTHGWFADNCPYGIGGGVLVIPFAWLTP
jgi:hypothetical protein